MKALETILFQTNKKSLKGLGHEMDSAMVDMYG
jgi:hypothetical protein